MRSNVRSKNMGEYECIDCNEMYHLDEPPEGYSICWDCKEERKMRPLVKRIDMALHIQELCAVNHITVSYQSLDDEILVLC